MAIDKIRTAIIGAGKVGHIHAKVLGALAEAEFVAVCSRNATGVRRNRAE